MARLGLGRKREEEEQARQAQQAESPQKAAAIEGRDYAKNVAEAKKATKTSVVSEHPTNPFKQTAQKSDAQLIADYDAEMAARDGMTAGNQKHDLGYNKITIDFSSIKNNEQAAYIASTMHDEKTKEEVLRDWASYSKQDSEKVLSGAEDLLGTRLFAAPVSQTGKNKATAQTAMQTLSAGLTMDANGNDIDMSSASLPMVIQSIRSDPNTGNRKEKVKALQTLTETPGSKFYGMTFDADLANTFLSGAGFDQDAYNKKVKEYDTAFYAESGHDEDNIQAYLTQVNEIQNGDDYGDTYSERQKRYLREALDNAFEQTTGHKAPTDDDIAAYNEQAQAARNSGKEPFSLKTFLFGDKEKQTDKQAEEQKEGTTADETPKTERAEKQTAGGQTAAAPEVQGPARQTENRAEVQGPVRQSTMTPDEAIAAQGGMTFEQWRAAELPRNLEQTAEEARAQELDALKADAENRTPAQTPEAAMTLYLKGEMLTDDEYSLISAYADSNAGKHLLNREGFVSSLDTASASLQKQAKSLYVPSTIPTEIGSTLEDAVGILKSGILDADTTGMGYLSLIQIMQDADAWIESGAVSIPSGKNPYNVYISTHDDANLVIQNIKEAQRTAVKQQQNEVTAQKQAEEEAYGASVERLTNGNGTEEDFQRVLGTSGFGSGAKRTDATYKELQFGLGTAYFSEVGEYWNRESASASEGMEGTQRDLFRKEVVYQAGELLNEYADVANGLGMTTREYLEKCSISGLDQLVDMAYNRMVRQGSDFLSSPTAQAGVTDNSPVIGVLPAAGAGLAGGAVSYADNFISASYNAVDALTYESARNEIMNSYTEQYGMEGRAVYREQLKQFANSGQLSEEQSKELLANIERAKDIYDIAYKIDEGWLGNGYRAFMGALDNMQSDIRAFGAQGNDFEQMVFNGAWSTGYSAAGMAVAGTAGALGAGGLASSAAAYGTTTWNENYEENKRNGLSNQVSAALALGPAVISTLVNKGEAVNEGNLYGGRSLLEAELAQMDKLKTATWWGKLKLYAKDLGRTAVGEGVEEVEEEVLTNVYNTVMYPVAQQIENGQMPQFSDVLSGLTSIDPAELIADGANSFVGGALGSVVFSLSGHLGLAIRRSLPGYTPPCITLSEQMLNGDIDVTTENVAEVTENLAEELQKPEVVQAVNNTARQAQDAQNTYAAAAAGAGAEHFETGNEQARMQREAQSKADAAQQAADAAKAQYEELVDAVMAGDLTKVKDMQAARVRMSENQKTANEYRDTAAKHQAAAQEAYNKGLDEARKRGAQISREENLQNAAQFQTELETMMEYADYGDEIKRLSDVLQEQETVGYDEGTKEAVEQRIAEIKEKRTEIADTARQNADERVKQLRETIEAMREANMDEGTLADYEQEIERAQDETLFYQANEEAVPPENRQTETLRRVADEIRQMAQTVENGQSIDENVADALLSELRALAGDTADTGEAISAAREGGRLQSAIQDARGADASMRHDVAELERVEDLQGLTREAQTMIQALQNGETVSQADVERLQKRIDAQIGTLDQTTSDLFAGEVMEAAREGGRVRSAYDAAQDRAALKKKAEESVNALTKAQNAAEKAEQLTQALKDGQPVSERQANGIIDDVYNNLAKMDDTVADILFDETEAAVTKAGELAVALDDAKERDKANANNAVTRYMEKAMQKEQAKRTYDALSGVANTLRNRKVYVNDSQTAEILSITGLKSISQVNNAYGTRFTRALADRAVKLDGQFYVELANMSNGYMEAASLHPEEDVMYALMARKKAYRDKQVKLEKPQDTTQVRRAAKGIMEGDVGAGAKENATYRGIEVQQPEGKADKGTNIVKATKKLAKDIGVGSTVGARNMKEAGGASAYYREVMRYMATDAKSAARVDVNMHEIGHAVSERTGLTGTAEMVQNLLNANPDFGTHYAESELPGEAMAEFMWRYMVNDEAAKQFAGDGFVETFERAVREKGMDEAVRQARTNVRTYLNQSVMEKAQAVMVNRSDIKSDEKLDEKFFYAFVDSTAPAEKANEIVRQNTGEKVVAFEDNLRESALLRNTADKRAYGLLTEALTDVSGNRIGEALKTRIAESGLKGKDFSEWTGYLLLMHSLDRDAQGKPVFDRYALTTAERRAEIARIEQEHPEFKKAANAFQAYRHDFMQTWMVDTGYMKQWQLDTFEAMYPNYVPTNRKKDNAPVGKGSGAGGNQYTIRAAKGSTEQIINPFDSFAEMTQKIVRMNMENQTNLMFDRLYNTYEGFGVLGRPIEQTESAYNDKQTGKLQETIQGKLEKAGADPFDIGDILSEIDADRTRFAGTANENNVITVQHADGSRTYYTITDPLFYKMMVNSTDSGGKALGLVGKLTHAMSALTTGSNPVFSLRNFLRDFQNSVNYGTWATSYADGVAKWLKTFGEVWRGESNDVKDYTSLGGGGWTRIETGNAKGAQELRGMVFDNGKWSDNYSTQTLAGKGKWAGQKLWNFATLARLNEVVEQTSRFVEYKYGKHDLTTDVGRAEAFRAGQEVTVDFSRKGAGGLARDVGNIVPFFNASLQGTYRTGRQFTKQESGQAIPRLVKTVLNTGATVALANAWMLMTMDDEDKEAFSYMSDDLKSKHLFIPNFAPDVFGDTPLIRIPIEQDPVAYAVNSLMTNVMWKGEGDEWQIDFATTAATIADGLYPVSGTIFDPMIATQTNKNWYGSRIVPSYMESWDPSTQYTDETADAFVALGRNIGISPMMAQYVAQQYTGFLGQVVIPAMSDKDADNPASAMLNATVSYARRQLTSDPLKSNDVVSRVYDNSTFLTTVVKAGDNGKEMNMLRGDLTARQAQRAYDDAYDMTHSGGVLYEAKKTFSEGYERIEAIGKRDDLTDEEKNALIEKIRMNMCRVALDANEEYAKFEEAYVSGEKLGSFLLKRAYGGTTIKKQK